MTVRFTVVGATIRRRGFINVSRSGWGVTFRTMVVLRTVCGLDYRGFAARARPIVLALILPAASRRIKTAAGPSGTPVLPQRRAETG